MEKDEGRKARGMARDEMCPEARRAEGAQQKRRERQEKGQGSVLQNQLTEGTVGEGCAVLAGVLCTDECRRAHKCNQRQNHQPRKNAPALCAHPEFPFPPSLNSFIHYRSDRSEHQARIRAHFGDFFEQSENMFCAASG